MPNVVLGRLLLNYQSSTTIISRLSQVVRKDNSIAPRSEAVIVVRRW